jgi:hypothetical protein
MARLHGLNSEPAFHATVKVKTELVHFVGARRGIEFSQAPQDSALYVGVDFRSFALPPEFTKGLASEGFDHDLSHLRARRSA